MNIRSMHTLRYRSIVIGICLFLAFFALTCLGVYLASPLPLDPGTSSYLLKIGKVLFHSFHYAAFFIPFYFAGCGLLLILRPFRLDRLLMLNYLILPFFTLALSLRLLFTDSSSLSPLPALVQRSFTGIGGGILALLLVAVELAFLPQLYQWIRHRFPPGEAVKNTETALKQLMPPPADIEFSEPEIFEEPKSEGPLQKLPAPEEETISVEPVSSVTTHSYVIPIEGILVPDEERGYGEIDDETQKASEILRATLEEFKIQAEVVGIRKGPVITMFEILPAPGVKLSRIVNLSDNIALRLAASSVRIVAPIPGKHAVGIEVPNKNRAIVNFAEMILEEQFLHAKMEIPIALGKDIMGEAQIVDLVNTPHLLIAGATGSGKSVCVNSIICSILYKRSPAEVKLLLIDPKIVELKSYNDIPHLLTPVITEPKRAFQALQYAIFEMERRYSLLDGLGVRDIRSYNHKIKTKHIATLPLPYLVIIIDEFADLMATTGKELESTLARLAAMSRAVGIHLVLATQRPSIDVITGLIKANIPSRIAFMVASKFDSRIIIDAVGAEKLLGRGDMLFASAWDPFPIRMQGAFVCEEEIERIVEKVKQYGKPEYIDDEIFIDEE
ncbi:MAG: DUF87 domain-containing protein, partial [Spirochaetales bacterium]|nr:DUF87 domain-containing protein [Spirochaetales bacterium]